MRKFILTLLVAFVAFAATAQTKTFTNDTITNTDNASFVFQTANFTTNNVYAWEVLATEVSGTPTVVVNIQHRVGADWVTLSSDTVISGGSPNAERNIYVGTDTPANGYRVYVESSGTGVTAIAVKAVFRKKE